MWVSLCNRQLQGCVASATSSAMFKAIAGGRVVYVDTFGCAYASKRLCRSLESSRGPSHIECVPAQVSALQPLTHLKALCPQPCSQVSGLSPAATLSLAVFLCLAKSDGCLFPVLDGIASCAHRPAFLGMESSYAFVAFVSLRV